MANMEIKKTDLYFRYENTDKKPLLLLHGFQGTSSSLSPLSLVSTKFDLIYVDMPGNGRSRTNEPLSIEYYNEVIKELILELGVTDLMVVGHSLGAATALAISNMKQITRTVLLSPFNHLNTVSKEDTRAFIKPTNIEEAIHSAKSMIFNKDKTEYFDKIDKYAKTFLRFVQGSEQKFEYILNKQILSKDYHENMLPKYFENAPKNTFVISGIQDAFVSKESIELIKKKYGFEYKLIDNCGHAPIFEQTEEVNNILEKLI